MIIDPQETDSAKLFAHFGTVTPVWELQSDSDTLVLSSGNGAQALGIPLAIDQAEDIRSLTGAITHRLFDLNIFGEPLRLHLVGRKVDKTLWSGTVASFADSGAVADNLSDGLRFAEQVVSEVNSWVVILGQDGKIKRFNKVCEEGSGFKEEEMIGLSAHELFMPEADRKASQANIAKFFTNDNPMEAERPVRTKKGLRMIHWRNKLVQSGSGNKEAYLVCSGTDVTEERKAQMKLVELANTDVLTGLPNRYSMQSLITDATEAEDKKPFGVIFLDLDNFKKVNDHYGHVVGDKLIVEVASAISECLRAVDTVARIGGDEFLISINDGDVKVVEEIALKILARMKQPFQLERAEIYSGCSIGVAMYPEHGETLDELVRNADTAMYVAKEEGKKTFRTFDISMHEKVTAYVWLDNNLRKAIEEEQFELYYQPKLNLKTGKVDSVEALIRWNSPTRGMINPMEFIPYAEESGMIVALGQWVIDQSARQAGEWKRAGVELRIAFNLSMRQLIHPTLVQDFKAAIEREGVFPSRLDVEITESCFMDDELRAHSVLQSFRDLGAGVHLDDFGTGFSSLSQLTRLPLDVIKLDRSFISSFGTDPKAKALVRAMVAAGQELDLKVVAEGVETAEQAKFLGEIGVNFAQGYLFGRPMPIGQFNEWMAKRLEEEACGTGIGCRKGA